MDNLILPDEDLKLIAALSRKHLSAQTSYQFADFIGGKGEGLILLLHGVISTLYPLGILLIVPPGPPGTGKTFTVGETNLLPPF
jgi:Cdc6-like AAA superfamily ATPase